MRLAESLVSCRGSPLPPPWTPNTATETSSGSGSNAPANDRAAAMIRIGDAYARSGQRERAIQVFDRVIASYGGDPETKLRVLSAGQKRAKLVAGR